MTTRPHTIHDFQHPPVIETVLSAQFAPVDGFTLPLIGLYWQKIRNEFGRFESKPPLGHIMESFPARTFSPDLGLSFTNAAELPFRAWFLDKKGNQIIQIQKDRFIYNWQKVLGNEVYPRYESVRGKFEAEWHRFIAFLEEERLALPSVNQCEVTYVNHIEYEKGWKGFGELGKVVSVWSGQHAGKFLPSPENVNLNMTYLLPDNQGRLYVGLQPVIRARDAKEVLQLNLTARIVPATQDHTDVLKWFDLGRLWIVEGFENLTTEEIRKVWGQTK